MEGRGQLVAHAGDRHLFFLHRLQKRRLGAGRSAVDFVRHQQLAEDRPFEKPEAAGAALGFFQHFRADDVGGHQVRCELDAFVIKP